MKGKPISNLNKIHPTTCPILAQVREQHKDRRFYYDYDYVCYILPDGRKELEHRLVARAAYGDFPDDYHVHHIDGTRTNNAAGNLYPCSPSEHSSIHAPRGDRVVKICPTCGAAFEIVPSRADRRKHCSVQCARHPSSCPPRDQLRDLLDDVGNFCELGRMFGVSDNAVRKWARRYDLSFSHVDGRTRRPT